MTHSEICAVLDYVLDCTWWVLFPASLVCIAYFFVALTRIGK